VPEHLALLNVSAEALPEPGVRATRTLHRDPLGRFSRPEPNRRPELVRPDEGVHHRVVSISGSLDDGSYPKHLRRIV
jgi:hypothetical protein